jgi:hypothetical protein
MMLRMQSMQNHGGDEGKKRDEGQVIKEGYKGGERQS